MAGEARADTPELEGWEEISDEELPVRPRNRLLRPISVALIAVLIAAAGFLGGVLIQKSSAGSGAGTAAGGLPSLAAAGEAGASATGGGESGAESGGAPSFGGSAAAATGTVTRVDGDTIYVKESDGKVVAVKAQDGATVSRDSAVAAKKVHPGDTVVVEGSKHGSTVTASSIAATEQGVETGSVESLFE